MKCEGVKNADNRLRVSARLYEDNDINNNNTTRWFSQHNRCAAAGLSVSTGRQWLTASDDDNDDDR